ncbi:hypothetical protein IQ266_00255 [filamentous cyanobacterium LEGE 11480]|uniref:Uncharacterized protein n=1 Tax=Romeriopsis navalis LEGE 11480 TaxID=2777977 RepID=A0A928VLG4_9CYAN|nr:hypothetical protein [Romeriopsis navalis]MBE9028184.1 hypothetical protein [Romeriopsis navalis LEGE 11480]
MQRRLTFLAALLVAASSSFWGLPTTPAIAATCSSQCKKTKPIQFRPGQRIEVMVVNRTRRTIMMENTLGDRAIKLLPGQKLKFYRGGSTDPNLSLAFWDATETPLKLALSQPQSNLLQIDVRFARRAPGDRALYIMNDGRIQLL